MKLVKLLIAVWIVMLGMHMYAKEAFGFEVNEVSFKSAKIYNMRDPFFPKYTLIRESPRAKPPINKKTGEPRWEQTEAWNHHVSLKLDLNLLKNKYGALYWDQEIVGQSTTRQFRRIFWDFEVGISIKDKVSLFHHHRSEHGLDIRTTGYPLRDMYGIKLCFFGKGCKR
jgi:hypothetical protein